MGVISGHTLFQVIAPDETMPFRGDFYPDDPLQVGEWDTEEVGIYGEWGDTFWIDEYGREGLDLVDVNEVTKESGKLLVEGEVFNESDGPAENVYVKAAVYNKGGKYTGYVWSSIDVPILPGKSAKFRVDEGINIFGGQEAVTYAGPDYSYDLWVSRDVNIRSNCG